MICGCAPHTHTQYGVGPQQVPAPTVRQIGSTQEGIIRHAHWHLNCGDFQADDGKLSCCIQIHKI